MEDLLNFEDSSLDEFETDIDDINEENEKELLEEMDMDSLYED